MVSQNFARIVWIHAEERADHALGKQDLLAKINCLNLIVAFAYAMKHRLRFEPYIHYDDIQHRVGHLDTYAKAADVPDDQTKQRLLKTIGQFLGVPMAESNPRKVMKQARLPLGNLPIEILCLLSSYAKQIFDNDTLHIGGYQSQVLTALLNMHDVLTGTDRILTTPLPIAYQIAVAQITYVYIFILPFQLYTYLGWVTIPASVFAAYIILGLAFIGREIENPFGTDVNDLPLDVYCENIRNDLDLIMAKPAVPFSKIVAHADNQPLYPVSMLGGAAWADKSVDEIRAALASKPAFDFYHTVHTKRLHRTDAHKAADAGVGHDGSADEGRDFRSELRWRKGY
jgi:putative membrane protein